MLNVTKRGRKKPKEFEFKGFVNLNFNDSEKVVIGEWIETFKPDVVDSLVVLCEAGYKVGFSYSDYHEALQVTATCRYAASKYYGRCFTFIHSDPGRAVAILRYVYDSMLAEELYELEDKNSKYDW